MTLLVVGLSHRSAPMQVLDGAALTPESTGELAGAMLSLADECVVLATCNRVEVYLHVATERCADTEAAAAAVLARHGRLSVAELRPHIFSHRHAAVAAHLFAVAGGLDSMVIGEPQILGQVRAALLSAREAGTLGSELSALFDAALRVGKRVRSVTGIQQTGGNVAAEALRMLEAEGRVLAGSAAMVLGAGSMATLAGQALRDAGCASVLVASRTPSAAAELAAALGGDSIPMGEVRERLGMVDALVSCTGARGELVSVATLRAATARRRERGLEGPLGVLDLAVPHDVQRPSGPVPGLLVRGLEHLGQRSPAAGDEAAAREVVTLGVAEYVERLRSGAVVPTVVALRGLADDLVSTEVARLRSRTELSEDQAREVEGTVRRVVAKLLHSPTVRVKSAAGTGQGALYEQALRDLFALDAEVQTGRPAP